MSYTANIITAVLETLDSRFDAMLNSHEAKMATTTMPKFRLCWLSPDNREEVKKALVDEATSLESTAAPAAEMSICPETDESDEEFFAFEKTKSVGKGTEEEIRRFFDDPEKNMKSLNSYPLVKQLFMKYNTTLPSSAPIERLFSYGGNVLASSRSRMSDEHMEQVLLRYNRKVAQTE